MHTDALQEKTRAAAASLVAAVVLTALKLGVGLYTNSLGLLSEAMHSGLDLVAAGMTLMAVRIAARPADAGHAYGHGKIENLSALLETALLLITCGWIMGEAVERLFFEAKQVIPSLWGVGVMVFSIIVDINRARMLKRLAKKHKSQALEADALHFASDIWSSSVVLVGLLALWFAQLLPPQYAPARALLAHADAVAALLVSLIVLKASFSLAKKSIHDLLDGSSEQDKQRIEALVHHIPGITAVRRVRIRNSGPLMFIDLVLAVEPHWRIEAGHHMAHKAEECIQQEFPDADVTVHVEPGESSSTANPVTLIQNAAATHNFYVHGLQLFAKDDSTLRVELHAEMPGQLSLAEAHQRITEFEVFLGQCLPGIEVISHMEPQEDKARVQEHEGLPPEELHHLEQAIARAMGEQGALCQCHNLQAYRRVDEGSMSQVSVCFHCYMAGSVSVDVAHVASVQLEHLLRQSLPHLGRIVIHMEPLPEGKLA